MTVDEDIEITMDAASLGRPLTILEPVEKVMIGGETSRRISSGTKPEGSGKPHYSRLLVYEDRLVLAVGCCKPLSVINAEMDGVRISTKTTLVRHSEEKGGRLICEFDTRGKKLTVDLKRGESPRFQRLVFLL
ncbi:MAG: hypothetical protein OEV28_14230 [Nitrospirota bacterium]|nr:hypothetical protein [Nitrospirota bacterium]